MEGHEWEGEGVYRKCRRCKAVKRGPAAPVRVCRPDPETGEVVEQEVAASSFEVAPDGPISEKVRDGILAGEAPSLIWPGDRPCPVEKGQEIGLIFLRSLVGPVPQVSITITAIRRGKRGEHLAEYSVLGERALYLRSRHGYTRSIEDSLDPEAPVLDEATLKAFNARSRLSHAEREEKRREAERRQERAVKSALSETLSGLGLDARAALLANIEREIQKAKMGRLEAA